jgi:hypothetical protein
MTMKYRNRLVVAVVLTIALILVLSGIAMAGSKAPDWVTRGSGAGEFQERRVFFGVGKAENIESKSRLFSTADCKARAALANVLYSFVDFLSTDYMTKKKGHDLAGLKNMEMIKYEQKLRAALQISLKGLKIEEQWLDREAWAGYSFCRVSLDHVREAINNSEEVAPEIKAHLNLRADQIHGMVVSKP